MLANDPSETTRRLLITPGEPAGIGPDLTVLLAQTAQADEYLVIADPDLLQARATTLGKNLRLHLVDAAQLAAEPARACAPGELRCLPVELAAAVTPGQTNPANARYVLNCLDRAVDLCLQGHAHALVTGPVHKAVINQAGIAFTGHTEYLAQRCGSGEPLMMLATPGLRVALATTHLPLREVADQITQPRLTRLLRMLHEGLQNRLGINQPHILVTGLNPHAGEEGHLGREELDIIIPALEALRRQGLNLTGPLPADTLFTHKHLDSADAVFAMYHDQGLPVLKHMGFGNAVNITLGLPILRTSVDHGTALELAGTGKIDTGSLDYALNIASQMRLPAPLETSHVQAR